MLLGSIGSLYITCDISHIKAAVTNHITNVNLKTCYFRLLSTKDKRSNYIGNKDIGIQIVKYYKMLLLLLMMMMKVLEKAEIICQTDDPTCFGIQTTKEVSEYLKYGLNDVH